MTTQRYDLVVLGAGLGGLAAAVRAHDLGLTTIVLEKSDQLGGVAAYSSGYQWCPGNHLAREAGIDDSWQDGYTYMRAFAGGTNDDHLLETLCRTAPEAYAYYDEHAGVRWCLFSDPDNRWPDLPGSRERGRCIELEPFDSSRLPDAWREIVRKSVQTDLYTNEEVYWKMGGRAHKHKWDPALGAERAARGIRYQGFALAAYFVMAVHERGIPMFTDVDVLEVLSEDGDVAGVSVRIEGEEAELAASNGLLIAMGGYDWNAELVQRFDKRTILGSSAPRSVTGDHFQLLEELRPAIHSFPRWGGGAFIEPAGFHGDPKERYQAIWAGFPHAIMVNQAGRRFGGEDAVPGAGNLSANERLFDDDGLPVNWPAFVIFDSQYRSRYQIGRTRPGEPLPDCFVSAGTIGELADGLGVDRAGLEDAVARFNTHAREGRDPEFHRGENLWTSIHYCDIFAEPNRSVGPVDEAPYYGVRLVQSAGASLIATGLVTDDRARVLGEDGEIIGNLYATGNSSAYRDVGRHYHAGIANTRNMTWAYIAATDAASKASPTVDLPAPAGTAT
jgi:3-oxosteroid 1-dehydrogenase